MVACAAGPAASVLPALSLPPISDQSSAKVAVEVEESTRPPFRRWLVVLASLLVVLALGGIGVAAALIVSDANKGEVISPEKGEVISPEPAGDASAETTPDPSAGGDASPQPDERKKPKPTGPASFSLNDVEKGATELLNAHHQALARAAGDVTSPAATEAFEMLSERKKQAEEDASTTQTARDYWATKRDAENLRIGSAACLPGTAVLRNPSDWDPETGVAIVYVDLGTYAGSTWVKYEDGRWTYDAGYAHVPERDARWNGAADETSLFSYRGGSC